MSIIYSIIIGGVIGWLAKLVMGGKKSSLLAYIIIGIVGGALGGWLAGLLGIGGGLIVQLLIGLGGSCLLIFLYRLIFGKK